ncbi:MAG: hypothetical protein LQ351_006020 [Letrouitia transgressa]|nr:MAG: hypothetical protein LQ351_006020 [Letrouitia transgressa]
MALLAPLDKIGQSPAYALKNGKDETVTGRFGIILNGVGKPLIVAEFDNPIDCFFE